VFQDKLFVYTGTWYSGTTTLAPGDYDLNQHLGYAVWSEDGDTWNGPTMLEGTFGHYIWRASALGNKAYLCGRRKTGFAIGPRGEGREVESLMLESDDGLIWRKRAVFQFRKSRVTRRHFCLSRTAAFWRWDGEGASVRSCSGPARPTRIGNARTWIARSAGRCW
jgi:hypothetical protein